MDLSINFTTLNIFVIRDIIVASITYVVQDFLLKFSCADTQSENRVIP